METNRLIEGGEGSGYWGHPGRPGEVGGSTSKEEYQGILDDAVDGMRSVGGALARIGGYVGGTEAGWIAGKAIGPRMIEMVSKRLRVSNDVLLKLLGYATRSPIIRDVLAYSIATAGSTAGSLVGGQLAYDLFNFLTRKEKRQTESVEKLDLSDFPSEWINLLEGGPGSGFYGHHGRPGERGGSLASGEEWAARRPVGGHDNLNMSPQQLYRSAIQDLGGLVGGSVGWEVGTKLSPKTVSFLTRLAPKIPLAGTILSFVNPYGMIFNLVGSIVVPYAIAMLFDYLQKEDEIKESFNLNNAKKALESNAEILKEEDNPIFQVIGPMIAEKALRELDRLSQEERDMVIPLFAFLGEANIRSIAESGKPLPVDNKGYPILPLKDQKQLGISDAQLEKLTPIVMLIATLGGLYAGWPILADNL
jgi:hypothetical protein